MESDPSTLFAQKLAANEKTIRDRAVRQLRRWLQLRSVADRNLTADEMVKLWKGLFYCMWMSDKPLIQEELSNTISNLIFCFEDDDTAFLFVDTFYKTMCREWYGIDQLRLDKFLMLIRGILGSSLEFIKKYQWQTSSIEKMTAILESVPMNSKETNKTVPLSFQIHIVDIYIEELAKASENEISPQVANLFLPPCCKLLVETDSTDLLKHVIKQIFVEIIRRSDVAIKRRNNPPPSPYQLEFDYSSLSKQLMEMSSAESVKKANRHESYCLVKRFDDLSKGKYPFTIKRATGGVPLSISDFNEKIDTLMEVCEKEREETENWKKRRGKRKAGAEDEEDISSDEEIEKHIEVQKQSNVISSNKRKQPFKKRKFFKRKKPFSKKQKGFQKKKTFKTKNKGNKKKPYSKKMH